MGILSSSFRTIRKWLQWFKDKFWQIRDYIHDYLWNILRNRVRELERRRDARESEESDFIIRAVVAGFSPGQKTHLSPMGIPGGVYSFSAKTEAISVSGMGEMPMFFPRAAMRARKHF